MSLKDFFKNIFPPKKAPSPKAPLPPKEEAVKETKPSSIENKAPLTQLERDIDAFYKLCIESLGADKVILKAGKLDAIKLLRSSNRNERVLALQKIIYEDPTIEKVPTDEEIPTLLNVLGEKIADIIARRNVEEHLEKRIAEKLEENHQDYVEDIRMQIIKEEQGDEETPQTREKLKRLEELDKISLTQSVMELLRPRTIEEIIGQERAVKALKAKLASPYPQHLILYGPPGVGKTTAARLALEQACKEKYTPFKPKAPFVETDGTTLRWDPRDMSNPLLGSVHDPIYQGARRDLADSGIPEPKPGLVTDAHGGILFIDEIGEMDEMLQNKLLKVLEDKHAYFESSYYDPTDPAVPQYIKKLFEEGAPADFILIGATTRDSQHINPALRSRCAEIYFEPLTPNNIEKIIENAAEKLHVTLEDKVAQTIGQYTIEGRKAINLLADAYSLALQNNPSGKDNLTIGLNDIYQVAQISRLSPFITKKASDSPQEGKIFGLGVAGFLGSIIEIEAVAFPAAKKGHGSVRFNDTAGSMAKDSVFNAAAVVRALTGLDISDYDIHINVIGGGNIDGPSAGTAITTAILSALTKKKIRQDTAVTGEISIQGLVRPVGGVFEKAYGAKQAGMTRLVIPKENEKDIPENLLGLQIFTVSTIKEALSYLLAEPQEDFKGLQGKEE